MKKQTQLADLIMGSGLVGGSARKQAPEPQLESNRPSSFLRTSERQQPVLYQYGGPSDAASRSRPSSGHIPNAVLGFDQSQAPAGLSPHMSPAPHTYVAWGTEADVPYMQAHKQGSSQQQGQEQEWVVEDVNGYSAVVEPRDASHSTFNGMPWAGSGSRHHTTDPMQGPGAGSDTIRMGHAYSQSADTAQNAPPINFSNTSQQATTTAHPSSLHTATQPPQPQRGRYGMIDNNSSQQGSTPYGRQRSGSLTMPPPKLPPTSYAPTLSPDASSLTLSNEASSAQSAPHPTASSSQQMDSSETVLPTVPRPASPLPHATPPSHSAHAPPPQPVAPSPIEEVLRHQVRELQARVEQLEGAVGASKQEVAVLMAAAAAKEEEQREAAGKQLRALKQAEEASKQADIARRSVERRAVQAEGEVAALRKQLDVQRVEHTKVVEGLRESLEAAQRAGESARKAAEEATRGARDEMSVAGRKAAEAVEAEKRAAQASVEAMKQEVAKRTQTILALQADLDAAARAQSAAEAHASVLVAQVSQLQLDLQAAMARAVAAEEAANKAEAASTLPAPAPSRPPTAPAPTPQPSSTPPPQSSGVTGGIRASSMRRGSSDTGVGLGGSSVSSSARQSQANTELAEARVQYARRLGLLEGELQKAEAAAKEAGAGCERLFQALVARTAAMLAGRVAGMAGGAAGAGGAAAGQLPPRPSTAAGSPARPGSGLVPKAPTPVQRAAAAAAAAGNSQLSLLYQMNDKLATENASLLAELARFSTGKHPLLKKQGLTLVAGGEQGGAPPQHQSSGGTPPLTTSLSSLSVGLNRSSSFGAAAAAGSGRGHTASPGRSSSTGTCPSGGGGGGGQGGPANTSPVFSAAKEALAVAAREVLLCSRKELLPAVMTEEGWGGGGGGGEHRAHSRADGALTTADVNLTLRVQLMALQAEVVSLKADLIAATTLAEERGATAEAAEGAARELRRDLATAQRSMGEMAEEARAARNGWGGGSSYAGSVAGDSAECDPGASLEDRLAAAKEEAQRARNAVAAAKRERDAREREVAQVRGEADALEARLREAKWDAQKQEEALRRLRTLLGDARGLLRKAGIPFMDDDPGPPPGTPPTGGGGSKGRPGSACRASADGSPFKSVDEREREREVGRLRAEVADLQHQLTSAKGEAKALRKQVAKAQGDARQASDAASEAKAAAAAAAEQAIEAAKAAAKRAERRAVDSEGEAMEARAKVVELSSTLERVRLDADYLRARAHNLKSARPKLTLANALSLSIAPG